MAVEYALALSSEGPPSPTLSLPDALLSAVLTANDRAEGLKQPNQARDAFYILLPLLIVLSTFFFLLVLFLVCVIILRRRRGIMLRDHDGPVDMSREELIEGEGGFEGVESRWLESVNEAEGRMYLRAKRKSVRHVALRTCSQSHYQSTSCSIHQIPRLQTSRFRSSCRSRRRVFQHGRLSPILRL